MWWKRLLRIVIVLGGFWMVFNLFFSTIYPIATYVREDVKEKVAQNGGKYLSIKEIPIEFQLAVISTEDRRFYSHPGFDLRGIGRALYVNLEQGPSQGGSTITQQLIRNTILRQERSVERKAKELALAFALETQMSKREILELYLNAIYFGDGAYGAEQAAQTYFGKPLAELSYPEWTLLAGLPNAPSAYNPYVAYDLAKKRQREVLMNLVETKRLTEKEALDYLEAPLHFAKSGG
ncbi:transglycosylase domain-containing protein [Effusibacillus consociatus]